ncbi:MAG: site-2 protease family protein [Deltaproteobacteria bacterium]|nr:site-2 protease family protein [Deltaproteobacteria bacterium]
MGDRARILGPLALAALTVLTTLIAGALLDQGGSVLDVVRAPNILRHGIAYSAGVIAVLSVRAIARSVVAAAHGVRLSPPHVIPAPTMIGTLGDFAFTEGLPASRAVLFDVAIAAPLAGFIASCGLAALGIMWSEPLDTGGLSSPPLGEPLLFRWLVYALKPEALDVGLRWHPLAAAAWSGLLVTALSLVPVGQLDGGHLAYAVFGKAQPIVSALALTMLVAVGVFFQSQLWVIWVLIVLLLGYRHPPVQESRETMGGARYALCAVAAAVLVVSFSIHLTAAGN